MELKRARYIFVSSFLILVLLDVAIGGILFRPEVVNVNDDACRENEVYSPCQADHFCEKNCDNIDIWESVPCIQTKNCVSGCICEEGYVRDKSVGVCVLENSCPRVRH
ncbi:venom serine protease inhibitor-like [Osmia bicornis bicornis]|uniref:venom serine protease inhibitor-like n=1 Tax=Osmia bicornis bicornis TaxID=1437191 RepID=UPI0010F723C5|nr:venom serine protease inhibitor-like [Osmia bicornis bicornis]